MDSVSGSMKSNWLQEYVDRSVRANLCTKIHCTTCGARDFRIGLLNQLQAETGIPAHGLFTAKAALALGEALAGIEDESSLEIEDAIRCILYDAWSELPHTTFEQEFIPRLASSWSARILQAMQEHYRSEQEARRAHAEYESPAAVAARREKRRREKQQMHAERLARKAERDRLWRQRGEDPGTPVENNVAPNETTIENEINDAFDNKRWEQARKLIELVLAQMPKDWRPIRQTELGTEGAFWDSEEFLAYVAHRDPDKDGSLYWTGWSYSKLWWQLAVVNRSQGLLDNALLCIEKGLELEPDHPYLWMQRGLILSEAGRFTEALAAYQTASVIRTCAPQTVIAWSLRSQGYALIELDRLAEAQAVYRHSLELDPESDVAENELGYIEHLLEKRDERSETLPWFLHCLRFPPTDPLTLQLITLVDGLEPIPGPKTVGSETYGRIASAFYERGWAGFEVEFDWAVPRSREDYADVKRALLREPIFLRVVHERLSRIYLGKATIEQVFDEIRDSEEPVPPQ